MTELVDRSSRPLKPRALARDGALDALRWLAILAMTVDHICNVLTPRLDGLYPLMRVLGPYSFYWIAAFHALRLRPGIGLTDLPWRSLFLMIGFALISQAPYELAFGRGSAELNMLWTLALAQVLLWGVVTRNPLLMAAAVLPALALEIYGPRLSYGATAVILPSIVWATLSSKGWKQTAWTLISAVALFITHMPQSVVRNFLLGLPCVWPANLVDYRFSAVALLSVWLVPAIYRSLSVIDWHLWVGPRWFFHAYYAGHLLPIGLIRWMVV